MAGYIAWSEMEAFGFNEIWSQLKEFVRRYPEGRGEVREAESGVDQQVVIRFR